MLFRVAVLHRCLFLIALLLTFALTGCKASDQEAPETKPLEREETRSVFERTSTVEAFDEPSTAEAEPISPLQAERAPPESLRLSTAGLEDFREAYRSHYRENARRLLHVTIDRPLYRPGQTLHWRSWHLAAGSLSQVREGRTVQVELLDGRGQVVHNRRVQIAVKMTSGSFEIDEEAQGGRWTLRLTDGDEVYERPVLVSHFEAPRFRKDVEFGERAYRPGEEVSAQIEFLRDTGEPLSGFDVEGYLQIGGRHVLDLSARLDVRGRASLNFTLPSTIENDDASLVLSVSEGGLVETDLWPLPIALSDVTVEFFPEGGNLVAGLTSRVYFEASDRAGKPVQIKGQILGTDGRRVATLETAHRGRGRFEFTPERGAEYLVALSEPQMPADFDFPPVEEEGCVLRHFDDFDSQKEALRVGVWCTETQIVSVLGAMGDELFDMARVVVSEEPAVVYLRPQPEHAQEERAWPRPAGITRVTVVEDSREIIPLAERVTFRGRRAQMEIRMRLNKEVYHPGETVEIELETLGPDGEPLAAEVAIAVVDDRVHAEAPRDIPSILGRILLLADDLHFWGAVKEADEYFDLTKDTAFGLDLLMGTRGWRSPEKREGFFVDGGETRIRPSTMLESLAAILRERARSRGQGRVPGEVALGYGRVGGLGDAGDDDILDHAGSLAAFGPGEGSIRRGAGGMGMRGSGGGGGGNGYGHLGGLGLSDAGRGGSDAISALELATRSDYISPRLEAEPAQTPQAAPSQEAEGASGAMVPRWFRDDDAVAFVSWTQSLTTDESGRATHTFKLPEAVGAYRVVIEGTTETGLLGQSEKVIPMDVPFSVVTRMPEILSGGDELLLPVTVRNATDEPIAAALEVTAEGPARVRGEDQAFQLEIPPRSTATSYVPVVIEDSREAAVVRVWARGAGYVDGAERTLTVEPRGFRRTYFHSGTLSDRNTFEVPLRGMSAAGAVGNLALYPGPVSEVLEGIEALARRPTGCFEQVSSTNYLTLLVWHYLEASGQMSAELREVLKSHLNAGYQRLRSFSSDGKSYGWFRNSDQNAPVTAWGMMQFFLMAEIVSDYDEDIVVRTAAWLRTLAREDGSWGGSPRTWTGGRVVSGNRSAVGQLFVLYALARVGQSQGLEKQLDRATEIGMTSSEPLEVAYAAAALAYSGHQPAQLNQILERLVSMQNDAGGWRALSGTNWTHSHGQVLHVETTAMALIALIKGNGPTSAIRKGQARLDAGKTRNGWWGSTHATARALEARTSFERAGLHFTREPVTLYVGPEKVREVQVESGATEPVRIEFGPELRENAREIRIESKAALEYDLEVTWRQEQFEPTGQSPLAFRATFGEEASAVLGEEISVHVTLENSEERSLGMVLARVNLPAGLEVRARELDALVERSAVDFYETTGREVILYFEHMDPEERFDVRFSAIASVPGRFEVPASVAYAYYRDESQWAWTDAGEFEVEVPR